MTKKSEQPEPSKKRGGSDTIRERGQKSVLVPVSPEEHHNLKVAAAMADVPMNEFIRLAAVAAARDQIEKSQKK